MNNRWRLWEKVRHDEIGLTTYQKTLNDYFNKFPRKLKKLKKKQFDKQTYIGKYKYYLNMSYGKSNLKTAALYGIPKGKVLFQIDKDSFHYLDTDIVNKNRLQKHNVEEGLKLI